MSRGTKGSKNDGGSKGENEQAPQSVEEFKNRASCSGNQIFKKLSPLASPQAIFENSSPDPAVRASLIHQINETKQRILQTEVCNMKIFLKRLLDDIAVQLPADYRKQMRNMVELTGTLSSPNRNSAPVSHEKDSF